MKYFLSLFILLFAQISIAKDSRQEVFMADWSSSCNSQTVSSSKVCVLEKHMFYDKSLTKKMISIAFRTASSEPVVMTIVSPLGSLIAEGVEVEIQGLRNKKLPFIFCDQRGCVSQIQLTEELLAGLQKQKSIQMKYQLLNSSKAVVAFDINGFDASFAKIKQ